MVRNTLQAGLREDRAGAYSITAMSIEEQDQILGRLTRQCSEAFRTVNVLGVKIQEISTALADVAKKLNGRDLLGPDGLGPKGTIAQALRASQSDPGAGNSHWIA